MLAIPTGEPSSQDRYHTIPQNVNGLKDLPHGRKLSFTRRSNVQCRVAGSQRLLLAWVWEKLEGIYKRLCDGDLYTWQLKAARDVTLPRTMDCLSVSTVLVVP